MPEHPILVHQMAEAALPSAARKAQAYAAAGDRKRAGGGGVSMAASDPC